MFKILLLQAMHGLSDERCEYLIKDRLSFMRFLGLGLADALARDAGPEVLEAARALIERVVVHPADGPRGPRKLELFGQFSALLRAAGALPEEGRENAASPLARASGLDVFCCSELGDAGRGIHGQLRIACRG